MRMIPSSSSIQRAGLFRNQGQGDGKICHRRADYDNWMRHSDTFIMPDAPAQGEIKSATSRPAHPEGMKHLSQWVWIDQLQTQNAYGVARLCQYK
jgi:hypothetical protein